MKEVIDYLESNYPETKVSIDAHQPIYHTHQPARYFYVIQEGCAVVRRDFGNKPDLVGFLSPNSPLGPLFGYEAWLGHESYSMSATAVNSVQLWKLPKATIANIRRDSPDLAIQIGDQAAQLSLVLQQRMADYLTLEVPARLTIILYDLYQAMGKELNGLSHTDIGAAIGARRETIQRAMIKLNQEGIASTGHKTITILRPCRLARLASENHFLIPTQIPRPALEE